MRIPTNGDCRLTRRTSRTSSSDAFVLTLWTSEPALAAAADAAGVDRIGIDLERLGKRERQQGRGTWISPHTPADLTAIAPHVTRAELFARVNPLHAGSAHEIDTVIDRGATVVMLSLAMNAAEASRFVGLVQGRATVVLLVEHVLAMTAVPEIVRVPGVDEIHIGLNDLAISLGPHVNRWMALAGESVAEAGAVARAAGLRFGLGGIGRAGDSDLPVPSDLVYAEYSRTGATAALLARSFFRNGADDLAREIDRTRRALGAWHDRSPADLAEAHASLGRCAARVVGL